MRHFDDPFMKVRSSQRLCNCVDVRPDICSYMLQAYEASIMATADLLCAFFRLTSDVFFTRYATSIPLSYLGHMLSMPPKCSTILSQLLGLNDLCCVFNL